MPEAIATPAVFAHPPKWLCDLVVVLQVIAWARVCAAAVVS